MPTLVTFVLSAAAVVVAGTVLTRYADRLAVVTGLGHAWIGAILVAAVTSLPELTTDLYAVRQGTPDLAIGDLFGSCMTNMLVLAVADLATRQVRILTRVVINQALVGSLAIGLIAIAAAGIVVDPGVTIAGIGWAPWLIVLGYLGGSLLLHAHRRAPPFEPAAEAIHSEAEHAEGLGASVVGFLASAVVIVVAARFLASSAAALADAWGLTTGFFGLALVAVVTSLPEITVVGAGLRGGSYDLAVGNLLGSNAVNMALLFALDIADGPASLLASVQVPVLAGAMFAILLTSLVVLGILVQAEPRVRVLDPGALPVVLLYGLGLYLTYSAGG